MIFNIPLRRKDTEVDAVPCTVEKSVTLSAEEFAHFAQNLMSDYDFIRENIDRMYQDENGVKHCLLVLGEGCADGILVESEGSTYARYSAFVPNARQLLQQYDPTLQSFCDRMQEAMERTVHSAPLHQENGMVRIPLSTLAPAPGEYPLDAALLSEMLSGQPELQAVELFGDEIVMQMDPKYIPAERAYRHLTEEQVQVACAKHLLWLYDEGGEQADFSGCDLSGMDLSKQKLNSAIFAETKLSSTRLTEAELCFADFTGAVLSDCDAQNISADEAEFKNAVLLDCDLSGARMEHCNFTGADLTGTALYNVRMQGACLDGATIPDCAYEQADLRNFSMDEQDWSDHSGYALSL